MKHQTFEQTQEFKVQLTTQQIKLRLFICTDKKPMT